MPSWILPYLKDPLPTVRDPRLPRGKELLWIFLIFASSRVLLLVFAGASTEVWHRWDALHYVNIASLGYLTDKIPAARVNFMSRFPPVFPALIWLVDWVPGISPELAGSLVAMASLLGASVLLYALMLAHFGKQRRALAAVAFLNFFPTAYFANSSYSEATFILLTAAYFWSLVRYDNFYAASVLAMGMVLCRTAGIIFMVTHFHTAVSRYLNKKGRPVMIAAGLALPLVAFAGHQTAVKVILRQPGYLEAQDRMTQAVLRPQIPFTEPVLNFIKIFTEPQSVYNGWMTTKWSMCFIFATFALVFLGGPALPPLYRTFSVSYLLFVSALSFNISAPRLLWVMLPLFMILGSLESAALLAVFLGVSGTGMVWFARIFTSGRWAF